MLIVTSYLMQALKLAQTRRGFCAPNPSVGALIVKQGLVIASGCHQGYGQAHAEVNALLQAKTSVRGADMYVTLIPCHHHGKTPPCTDVIKKKNIKYNIIIATIPKNAI